LVTSHRELIENSPSQRTSKHDSLQRAKAPRAAALVGDSQGRGPAGTMRMKKWRLPVVAFSFLTPFFFPEPPLYPRIGKALRLRPESLGAR